MQISRLLFKFIHLPGLATGVFSALAIGAAGVGAQVPDPLVVNTTLDTSGGDCTSTCSLREAIAIANDPDADRLAAVSQLGTLAFCSMSFDRAGRKPDTYRAFDALQEALELKNPRVIVSLDSPLLSCAREVMDEVSEPMQVFRMRYEPAFDPRCKEADRCATP